MEAGWEGLGANVGCKLELAHGDAGAKGVGESSTEYVKGGWPGWKDDKRRMVDGYLEVG